MTVDVDDMLFRISELNDKINLIEKEITDEIEILKEWYSRASTAMLETQNYFLNGIQASSLPKSYLLTHRGIEVQGEESIPISIFFDNVLQFANDPSRKIEVLRSLGMHLHKINEMLANVGTS